MIARSSSGLPDQLAESNDLIATIRAGADFKDVEKLASSTSLTIERLADALSISRRTLSQRKQEGRLKSNESDRLIRFARLWQMIVDLHDGDLIASHVWLTTPKKGLANESPLNFARSEVGSREVESLIGRLTHGVFS